MSEVGLCFKILDFCVVFSRQRVSLPECLFLLENILLAKEIRLQVHDLDIRILQEDPVELGLVGWIKFGEKVFVLHEVEIRLHC